MNVDIYEAIYKHLQWQDKLELSHVLGLGKPSQFEIASQKLSEKGFDPYENKYLIHSYALKFGCPSLCTEALMMMYDAILDCKNLDYCKARSNIQQDLLKRDKDGRKERVARMLCYLQSWDSI